MKILFFFLALSITAKAQPKESNIITVLVDFYDQYAKECSNDSIVGCPSCGSKEIYKAGDDRFYLMSYGEKNYGERNSRLPASFSPVADCAKCRTVYLPNMRMERKGEIVETRTQTQLPTFSGFMDFLKRKKK